jgi:hypothetical protein
MQNFACPSCGGTIAYSGTAPTTVCPYCGNTVAVPDELRQPGLALEAQETGRKATRWIVIFLVLVVGVPTCVGLAGTVISVAVGLLVPILTIFAAFLGGN